jgi:hypothetical protein
MLAVRLDAIEHVAYAIILVSDIGALFLEDLVHDGKRHTEWRGSRILFYIGRLRKERGSRMEGGVQSTIFLMRNASSALPRGDRHRRGDLIRVTNIKRYQRRESRHTNLELGGRASVTIPSMADKPSTMMSGYVVTRGPCPWAPP